MMASNLATRNMEEEIEIYNKLKDSVLGPVVVILANIVAAIFAPMLAPYNPNQPDLDNVLLGPTHNHWLGTDALGRDTLSRVIFGTRASLLVGLTAIGMAAVIGMTLLEAVSSKGGGEKALLRHTVAAILNASHPAIDYPMTVAQIISAVQSAYATGNFEIAKDLLEGYNQLEIELGYNSPNVHSKKPKK